MIRWKEICQALGLSQGQAAEIVALWHEFHSRVTELFEQRKQIHHGLGYMAHTGTCGKEFAEEYLKVSLDAASLEREYSQSLLWVEGRALSQPEAITQIDVTLFLYCPEHTWCCCGPCNKYTAWLSPLQSSLFNTPDMRINFFSFPFEVGDVAGS